MNAARAPPTPMVANHFISSGSTRLLLRGRQEVDSTYYVLGEDRLPSHQRGIRPEDVDVLQVELKLHRQGGDDPVALIVFRRAGFNLVQDTHLPAQYVKCTRARVRERHGLVVHVDEPG